MIDEKPFTVEQCEELFAAVLSHDDLHLAAELPDEIHLDYTQEQLGQCYRICRQLWREGVDIESLRKLVKKLYKQRFLDPEDQLAFMHIRAKFKHLRFAYVTFDERHCYPTVFHRTTLIMGKLQDAFKNEHYASMGRFVIYLRFLLSKFIHAFATREIARFRPGTPEIFRNYVNNEIHYIRQNLAKEEISSKTFHQIRKVISRQTALYDNLKILYPSHYHNCISQYFSTINGMMGGMHDDLIVGKLKKTQNYYSDTFEIPEEIKQRLISLTEKYKEPL